MSYVLFEILALTVGAFSTAYAIVATMASTPPIQEVIAQGLLLAVLVGAVHRGRRGGMAAALTAIVAYLALRAPLIVQHGFTPEVSALVLTRVFTFALVGIGGGTVCGRVQQILARLDSVPNLDPHSQLFNERYANRTIRSRISEYRRYRHPFSLVLVSLPGFPAGDPGPADRRPLRKVATHVREHLRLVDEVARLDDGRLALVLPQTAKPGARIAAERVMAGVRRMLGENGATVSHEILDAAEDLAAIQRMFGLPEEPDSREDERRAA